MSSRTSELFNCVRTQGGLLPSDFLARIADPGAARHVEGLKPEDYHLAGSQKITEAVNRSWNSLQGRWQDLKARVAELPGGDAATGITRDLWLLPLFHELGYGRLQTAPKFEIEDRHYPVSHLWGHTPVHLLGVGLDLDRSTRGAAGAARMSPHSMMQEFLNRSDAHLWAILSNGHKLRLLRDNAALTRQAFVEFDLYAMFEGEAYSDFVLLWLLCHQSRVEGGRPEQCWLEKWTNESRQQGVRLLDGLRKGVEQAIEHLGAGFLAHPANQALRDRLRKGDLTTQDYYRQILRLVYRFLFLFVAEDRDLLLLPGADESAKGHYRRFYSTRRLRQLAERHGGTRHADLWELFKLVTNALGSSQGCPALGLPALGSYLWRAVESTPDIAEASLPNRHLLDAIRALATVRSEEEKVRRLVDYRNLGPEELGSVYESLLELHPEVHAESAVFKLNTAAGNERKTSGSYYTPDSLVQCLLDSTLEPVVKERLAAAKTRDEKEKALLSLKVCDPAVGSGHFLIAAAHRLARHLASIRSGEDEPSPLLYQHALRDVVGHCLYGVDINPMSAELCRVSLWLEALEPGKPLSFLDHRIRVGNSLLGAPPELIAAGLPDDAYNAIEGDDKAACASLKKLNKAQREGLRHLFIAEDTATREKLFQAASAIDEIADDSPEGIRRKEAAFRSAQQNYDFQKARDLANLWCAAFVIQKQFPSPSPTGVGEGGATAPGEGRGEESSTLLAQPLATQVGLFGGTEELPKSKDKKAKAPTRAAAETPIGITTQHLRDFVAGGALPDGLLAEAQRLAGQYQFFHFHLAFPEVAAQGGFDLILANPPWERVKLQEKEWFAAHGREDIANAPNAAARKRLIAQLQADDPAVHRAFLDDVRKAEGESHLLRNSGRYPLCGRGDINLYAVFAEGMRSVLNPGGRMGAVLPSGIATDDTTKFFFQDVVETNSLRSLFDFENRNALFPGVHRSYKFCLFTSGSPQAARAGSTLPPAEFAFFCLGVEDLRDPDKRFALSPEDIALLNPNTRTCPIFRSRRDAELTKAIYRRVPVLIREARDGQPEENPWGIKFSTMFHMSNDSHLFRTREQLEADGWTLHGNRFRKANEEYLPLYEAKMIHHFDHRWAEYANGDIIDLEVGQKANPNRLVVPQYWVTPSAVDRAVGDAWKPQWILGFRDICRSTDERTVLATTVPRVGIGNKIPLLLAEPRSAKDAPLLQACLGAFAFDFPARQKVGGITLNYFIVKQLPILGSAFGSLTCNWAHSKDSIRDWLLPRVLELTYTAWDLEAFAQDCGWSGPPFRWDEERRFLLRCELDAAFFHLYLPAQPDGSWQPARRAAGCPHDETPEQLAELQRHFPTPRAAVAYILDTFPIVKRKDEARTEQKNAAGEVVQPGRYITKDTILEIYDALAASIRTGQPYPTRLDPPPADASCCHPQKA